MNTTVTLNFQPMPDLDLQAAPYDGEVVAIMIREGIVTGRYFAEYSAGIRDPKSFTFNDVFVALEGLCIVSRESVTAWAPYQ